MKINLPQVSDFPISEKKDNKNALHYEAHFLCLNVETCVKNLAVFVDIPIKFFKNVVQFYGNFFNACGGNTLGIDVTYGTVEQTYFLGECKRSVYGIAAYEGNDINKVSEEALAISNKPNDVEALAKLCNVLELSPIHLKDVAEDYIFTQKKLCQK